MTRDLFQRGDRLGEYEILGRLRAGGMATLFLGRRHGAAGVSRQVVIKVIHPHLAEDELIVKMFIDEARICSNISHGNVVYVEKLGEHDGVYYMVMEYVDGCSLEQLLRALAKRGDRLAPDLAAHLVIEAAAGLHAAHETCGDDGAPLNIVHRDVSPSNILITRDGRVKVIDFGIAKARGRLGETKSGASFKGKLRYMSPEQAFGRAVDRKTDVYALGIVLWELLACKHLFDATEDMVLLEQVRDPHVPPARERNPDVGHALEAVIGRALAKDVANRLATANELRRELIQAVPGALQVDEDRIGGLVSLVRDTLGLSLVELEQRPPTPIPTLEVEIEASTTVEPALSSVRGAAGEVTPNRRRAVGWLAFAGSAAVAAIVTVVVFATRTTTTEVAPAAAVTPPSPPPVVHAEPPKSEPVPPPPVQAPPPAKPAVVRKKPVIAVKKPVSPNAVKVDGVLLSDEPDKPAKPKPKQPGVRVDGTVLSP